MVNSPQLGMPLTKRVSYCHSEGTSLDTGSKDSFLLIQIAIMNIPL